MSDLPSIEHGMSLNDILTAMDAVDRGVLALTEEQAVMLRELLLAKVDGCKFVLDSLEDEAKRHDEYAAEHGEAADQARSKKAWLEQKITQAMLKGEFLTLPGKEFQVRLHKSESLRIEAEPTPELAAILPEFVRVRESVVTYEWDKVAVKKAMSDGLEFPYGKIVTKHSPKFSVRKATK